MRSDEEMFTPETVDEQVEQLSRSLYAIPSRQARTADVQLVQNLRRMYALEQEDARSVQRVQHRLEQQGWLVPERRRTPPPGARHTPAPALQAPAYRERRSRGWTFRLATVAAVLLVTTLIGGLVVGLVLVHPNKGSQPASTATPIPPAPPSVYGISNNNVVIALNLADGKERWRYPFTPTAHDVPSLLETDDTLYLFQPTPNLLTALNKNDGTVRWQKPQVAQVKAVNALVVMASQATLTQGAAFTAYDPRTGKKLWAFQAPKEEGGPDQIVLADDTVYVEVSNSPTPPITDHNPHYFVYALDRTSGKQRWTFQTRFYLRSLVASGDSFYVEQNVSVGAGPNVSLIALNTSDGKERWHANDPADQSTQLGPPVVVDGVVYVALKTEATIPGGNIPMAPAPIKAFRASDGQELWHSTTARAGVSYSDPTVANGMVYATDQNYAYAFNAVNGSLLWQKKFGYTDLPAPPVVRGKALYIPWREPVGIEQTYFGLVALDTGDGHEIWRYSQPPFPVTVDPALLGIYSGPANGQVLGSVIILRSPFGVLLALNVDTGQKLWQTSLFSTPDM